LEVCLATNRWGWDGVIFYDTPMRVFLSYSRQSGGWAARSIKERLERRGADVFLDVESINSGRFETVIRPE
jgi:hypothetical protein